MKRFIFVARMQAVRGATLLEMMVSLFVMGVGMLGVLGLQTQAMRFNHQAYSYSQAVFLAQEILERMRANPIDANNYTFNFDESVSASKNCGSPNASCTPAQLREWDIANWQESIANRLPAGKGQIDFDGDNFQILLEFDLIKTENDNLIAENTERQRYVLNAGL